MKSRSNKNSFRSEGLRRTLSGQGSASTGQYKNPYNSHLGGLNPVSYQRPTANEGTNELNNLSQRQAQSFQSSLDSSRQQMESIQKDREERFASTRKQQQDMLDSLGEDDPYLQSVQQSIDRIDEYVKNRNRYGNQANNARRAGAQSYSGPGSTPGNIPDNLSGSRQNLLQDAYSYVGDPYVLGGISHNGIDCSGLIMAVYNRFGFNITHHGSRYQGQNIPGVRTSVSNLAPGDIVAWQDGSHIAIYAGNGMIISAADYGEGVKYQPVWGNVFGIAVSLPGENR